MIDSEPESGTRLTAVEIHDGRVGGRKDGRGVGEG